MIIILGSILVLAKAYHPPIHYATVQYSNESSPHADNIMVLHTTTTCHFYSDPGVFFNCINTS
jgi:hypothetical protein